VDKTVDKVHKLTFRKRSFVSLELRGYLKYD